MLSQGRLAVLWITACAVISLPATAGVNRWTPRGPAGAGFGRVVAETGSAPRFYVPALGAGVFQSDDGFHWTAINDGLDDLLAQQLAVSREEHVIDVATKRGNIFERQAGAWKRIGAFDHVVTIARDAATDALYAATERGIQKFDGNVWISPVTPLPAFVNNFAVLGNAMMVTTSGSEGSLLYVSTDAGGHWTAAPKSALAAPTALALAVNPVRGTLIAASRTTKIEFFIQTNIWITTDIRDATEPCTTCAIHDIQPDGDGLVINTDAGIVVAQGDDSFLMLGQPYQNPTEYICVTDSYYFASGSSGMFVAQKGSGTWTSLNDGFSASPTYGLAADGDAIYALSSGLFKAKGDAPFARLNNARVSAIGTNNHNAVYMAIGSDLMTSTDGGQTWKPLSSRFSVNEGPIYAVSVTPSAPSIVYVVDAFSVWRSEDRGSTWTPISSAIESDIRYEYGFDDSRLAVDPRDADTLYVWAGGMLYRHDPTGWTKLGNRANHLVATDSEGRVYSADESGLLASSDRGLTWHRAGAGIDGIVTTLSADALHPDILYAGTDEGIVYRTTNAAATWNAFGDGLTHVPVTALLVAEGGKRILAATIGGVYQYDIDDTYLAAAVPHPISLRTWYGNFVSVDSADRVVANGTVATTFTLYDVNAGELNDGDVVYLRDARGDFIAAEGGGAKDCGGCEGSLIANRPLAGAWESFIVRRAGGSGPIRDGDAIAFVSRSGNYVTAENGGAASCGCDSALHANRTALFAWETFMLKME